MGASAGKWSRVGASGVLVKGGGQTLPSPLLQVNTLFLFIRLPQIFSSYHQSALSYTILPNSNYSY